MSASKSLVHTGDELVKGIAGDSTQQKINIREVWQRKFDFTSDSIIKYQVWLSDTKSNFNINRQQILRQVWSSETRLDWENTVLFNIQ